MKKRTIILLIYILPLPILLASLFIGPSQSANPQAIIDLFLGKNVNMNIVHSIIMDVRLPRVLLTFLVGGALAISGCSIQAIFRNPLTDSYILCHIAKP